MSKPEPLFCRTPEEYLQLTGQLAALSDEGYRKFHGSLVPGIGRFYGVRVPALRALAKQLAAADGPAFLALCQDDSYEETMLRGLVTGYTRWPDVACAFSRIADFVPHIQNWAVCDVCTATFRVFAQEPAAGFALAEHFLNQPGEYEKRFGAVVLLDYYVNEAYIDRVLALLCATRYDGYYYKMAAAWAFSVCYVKFPDRTLAALATVEDGFIHNKALQKCCESLRVPAAQKQALRALKRPV